MQQYQSKPMYYNLMHPDDQLVYAAKPFKIDVEVVDILRDKADLEFKRDSQAKVSVKKGELVVRSSTQ